MNRIEVIDDLSEQREKRERRDLCSTRVSALSMNDQYYSFALLLVDDSPLDGNSLIWYYISKNELETHRDLAGPQVDNKCLWALSEDLSNRE